MKPLHTLHMQATSVVVVVVQVVELALPLLAVAMSAPLSSAILLTWAFPVTPSCLVLWPKGSAWSAWMALMV